MFQGATCSRSRRGELLHPETGRKAPRGEAPQIHRGELLHPETGRNAPSRDGAKGSKGRSAPDT
eukprot:1353933-Pyramimonas_sp.AAC.1